ERLAIAHALRDHEVDLVVIVERLAVQSRMAVAPPCDEQNALRPARVSATGGAMPEQPSGDTPVLAWRELVEPIELDDVLSLGQVELSPKRARVSDLVDVDQNLPFN